MPSEMTPEEKLLALIQQDRRAAGADASASGAASVPKAGESPKGAPASLPVLRDGAPTPGAVGGEPVAASPEPVSAEGGKLAGAGIGTASPAAAAQVAGAPENQPSAGTIGAAKGQERTPQGVREPVVLEERAAPLSKPAPVQPREDVQGGAEGSQGGKLRLAPSRGTAEAASPSKAPTAPLSVEIPGAGMQEPAEVPSRGEPSPAAPVSSGRTFRSSAGRTGVTALGFLNRTLGLVVLVLLVVVVYSAASVRSDVDDAVRAQREGAGDLQLPAATVEMEPVPPVEQFLVKVSARSLFVSPVVVPPESKPDTAAATRDLKLMGISLDAKSPSESMAIIKNRALSQTYFLKPGQALGDTGLTIERVLQDRVVLKLKKTEIELK